MASPASPYKPLPDVVYEHQALLAIMIPGSKAWDAIDPNDKRIHPMLRSEAGRIFLCILSIITILPILILSFMKHPISINGSKSLASHDDIRKIFMQAVNLEAPTPPPTNSHSQQNNNANRPNTPRNNHQPPAPTAHKDAPIGLTNSIFLGAPLRNVCFLNSMIQIFVHTSLMDTLEQAYKDLHLELALATGEEKPQNVVLVEQFIAITDELRSEAPDRAKITQLTLTFYRAYCAYHEMHLGRQRDSMGVFRTLFSILDDKEGKIGHRIESFFTDEQENLLEGFEKRQDFEYPLNVTRNYSTMDKLITANFTSKPDFILHPIDAFGERRPESVTDYKVFEYHFNQLGEETKGKHQKFFAKDPKNGENIIKAMNFERQKLHSDRRHRQVRPTLLKLFNKKMRQLKDEFIQHLKEIGMHTTRLHNTTIPNSSQMFIVSTTSRSQIIKRLDETINIHGDTFTLVATLLHTGSVTARGSGGHYVSYVKKNDKWWRCSDMSTTPVTKPSGQFKTLFYQRVNNEDSSSLSDEEG